MEEGLSLRPLLDLNRRPVVESHTIHLPHSLCCLRLLRLLCVWIFLYWSPRPGSRTGGGGVQRQVYVSVLSMSVFPKRGLRLHQMFTGMCEPKRSNKPSSDWRKELSRAGWEVGTKFQKK